MRRVYSSLDASCASYPSEVKVETFDKNDRKKRRIRDNDNDIERSVACVSDYICDDRWRRVDASEMRGSLSELKQRSKWGKKVINIE